MANWNHCDGSVGLGARKGTASYDAPTPKDTLKLEAPTEAGGLDQAGCATLGV